MEFVLQSLLETITTTIMPLVDYCFNFLTAGVFNVETVSTTISAFFDAIMIIIYGFGISLIVMRFLWKGFQIYGLWVDGDPESNPIGYLMNFLRAMVVAITFPYLYEYFINITLELLDSIFFAINFASSETVEAAVSSAIPPGLLGAVWCLVFFVCAVMLLFSFVKRGFELLVLRIGVPIACVGLLDNDKGVFKAYALQFIKAILTTLIQIVLARLALTMVVSSVMMDTMTMIWAIGCMGFAVSVPKILREFLLPTDGGGISKIYYGANMVRSVGSGIKSVASKLVK